MRIDTQMIWDKIKENKGLILNIVLAFFFLISLYKNFTFYNDSQKVKNEAVIQRIDEDIATNRKILENIKSNMDSLHVAQKFTLEKIDGTQASIRVLEKQRYEKIKYVYTNNVDSTVKLLRDRYSKLP